MVHAGRHIGPGRLQSDGSTRPSAVYICVQMFVLLVYQDLKQSDHRERMSSFNKVHLLHTNKYELCTVELYIFLYNPIQMSFLIIFNILIIFRFVICSIILLLILTMFLYIGYTGLCIASATIKRSIH